MPRRRPRPLDECPNCGAEFRAGRPACPECGSDADTGWRDAEDIDYTAVEIPDTWDEMTDPAARRPADVSRRVKWIALAVVTALVLPLLWPLLRRLLWT